jgi:cytoskeletal protein RodZ
MNKTTIVSIFFIIFILFEILVYYIYKNKNSIKESFLLQKKQTSPSSQSSQSSPKKNSIKEPFLEAYQGSETNYESCKKSGYPHQWCLHIQEPYSIANPNSLTECMM